MRRRLTASAIGLAACGHIGFDERDPEPVLGSLACGESRALADLSAVPLGLGLAATDGGAVAAWSRGTPAAKLEGIRVDLEPAGDAIAAVAAWSTPLPDAIGSFGLTTDGDARFLVAAPLAAGALLVPLDREFAAGDAWTLEAGVAITTHAVAEPIAAGGRFAAARIENGEAVVSLLDEDGASTGTVHSRTAIGELSIRRGDRRHIVVWSAPGGGCAVWAFDDAFVPVLPDPLVHAPAGACRSAAITRHDVGVNLLAWIDGDAAHGQLGTDTNYVGTQLSLGAAADDLDLAIAPAGFFTAVAAGTAVIPGHVRTDTTGWRPLPVVPHLAGTPIRLAAHRNGALLASVGTSASAPQLWLTRLCEP